MLHKGFLVGAAFLTGILTLLRKRPAPETDLRRRASSLIQQYLPCDQGDAHFAEICRDFGGQGTTCGYLPSWLLWRLGAPPRLVNRTDSEGGYTYKPGANISIIRWQPEFHVYRSSEPFLPLPGDIYFISNGPYATEHVGVVLGIDPSGSWVCADLGQTNGQGLQCGRILNRTLRSDGMLYREDGAASPRTLIGWLDLEKAVNASR